MSQRINSIQGATPTGAIIPYAGFVAPSGFLLCNGQAVSRSTYNKLFDVLNPSLGTVTVALGSNAVFTQTAHGLQTGDMVYLTTSGALPTGVTANNTYWVTKVTVNTFRLSNSQLDTEAFYVSATVSQSGTHTLRRTWGVGNGSTTFTLPELRGATVAGSDAMGGTSIGRLTDAGGIRGSAIGASGGAEKHTLGADEMAHTHPMNDNFTSAYAASNGWQYTIGGTVTTTTQNTSAMNTPTATAHNNLQPTTTVNMIIAT